MRLSEAVIAQEVVALIAQHQCRNLQEMQPDLRLVEDLGFDSLGMQALLLDIESLCGVLPMASVMARVSTVGDLTRAISRSYLKEVS